MNCAGHHPESPVPIPEQRTAIADSCYIKAFSLTAPDAKTEVCQINTRAAS